MFIRGLFRLVYYAFTAYMVWSVYRLLTGASRRKARPSAKPRLSGMMVKDEICQTYLPKENALRETSDGREHYFCSPACRTKFLAGRRTGKPQ